MHFFRELVEASARGYLGQMLSHNVYECTSLVRDHDTERGMGKTIFMEVSQVFAALVTRCSGLCHKYVLVMSLLCVTAVLCMCLQSLLHQSIYGKGITDNVNFVSNNG